MNSGLIDCQQNQWVLGLQSEHIFVSHQNLDDAGMVFLLSLNYFMDRVKINKRSLGSMKALMTTFDLHHSFELGLQRKELNRNLEFFAFWGQTMVICR